jgi:hypothetical protein
MSDQTTDSTKPGILSIALKWLSIPVTVFAGYFFGATHVHNAAYDRARRHNLIGPTPAQKLDEKNQPIFKDNGEPVLVKEKPTIILGKVDAVNQGFKDAAAELVDKGSVDLNKTIPTLDKAANAEIKESMKKIGLGNIFKQWDNIHASDKQEALMRAFTAAGITIGALFAIANTKTISQALARKDADNKEQQIS